jgi:hypothetical protein
MMEGPGADSEEKHEPVSDIDIAVVDSLKCLTPNGRLEKRTWSSQPPNAGLYQERAWRLRSREGQLVSSDRFRQKLLAKWNLRRWSEPRQTSRILLSASHVFRPNGRLGAQALEADRPRKRTRAAGMFPAARALRSDVVRRAS